MQSKDHAQLHLGKEGSVAPCRIDCMNSASMAILMATYTGV